MFRTGPTNPFDIRSEVMLNSSCDLQQFPAEQLCVLMQATQESGLVCEKQLSDHFKATEL